MSNWKIVSRKETGAPYIVYRLYCNGVEIHSQIGPISDADAKWRIEQHERGLTSPRPAVVPERKKPGPKPKGSRIEHWPTREGANHELEGAE